MKTSVKIFVTVILMAILSTNINAKVWRINNIPGVNADFSSLSSAITAAAAGDTLYVEGSHLSYGDVTLSKRLIIIGTGYFITNNDSTQANPSPSRVNLLTINNGAQGSIITGITADGTPAHGNSTVTVNTSDITFLRCYFYSSAPNSGTYTNRQGAVLRLSNAANNIVISGCYIYQTYSYTPSSCSSCSFNVYSLQLMGNNNNIIINNNIIRQGSRTSATTTYNSQYAFWMSNTSYAVITNNIFIGASEAYNSSVANNIQIIGGVSGNFNTSGSFPCILQNNIGHSTQFGTSNGNQSNVTMANVFTYTGAGDGVDHYYKLKVNSPALGAGVQGEDCGVFGGAGAMKLSGLPGIPAIFQATVPPTATTTGGMNINIKAKVHE